MEPCVRALLKSLDGLLKETYHRRLSLSNIPRRLLHVHLFRKVTIKKGIGDVELMKRPCLVESYREENVNGTEASHMREGLSIVETIGLGEPPSHKTCLVASDGAIWIVLEGVH